MGMGERGVQQVPMAGGIVQINAMTSAGTVPVTLLIDPDSVSPELRAQMIARVHRWLDRLDPPLRLVSGAARPAPAPRSPAP